MCSSVPVRGLRKFIQTYESDLCDDVKYGKKKRLWSQERPLIARRPDLLGVLHFGPPNHPNVGIYGIHGVSGFGSMHLASHTWSDATCSSLKNAKNARVGSGTPPYNLESK